MEPMMIVRLPGKRKSRCRAAIHGNLVYAVAVAPDKVASMYEQTRAALADADATLAEAGTEKSRILTAMVYVADMQQKDEMNRAWEEWADLDNPPMRACVGATLADKSLVEIVFTAAL
jgi:enamine deaminase RidA (YjgF/YER057c/UK114 family)